MFVYVSFVFLFDSIFSTLLRNNDVYIVDFIYTTCTKCGYPCIQHIPGTSQPNWNCVTEITRVDLSLSVCDESAPKERQQDPRRASKFQQLDDDVSGLVAGFQPECSAPHVNSITAMKQ
jgi:hypothetical protein